MRGLEHNVPNCCVVVSNNQTRIAAIDGRPDNIHPDGMHCASGSSKQWPSCHHLLARKVGGDEWNQGFQVISWSESPCFFCWKYDLSRYETPENWDDHFPLKGLVTFNMFHEVMFLKDSSTSKLVVYSHETLGLWWGCRRWGCPV